MPDIDEILQQDDGLCVLRRSQRVCDFFNRESIFFNHGDMTPDDHYPVVLMKNCMIEQYSLRSGNIAGTMGAFTYVYTEHGMFDVAFGRYCSVASDVTVLGERHPVEWVTTSSIASHFGKANFARAHRELMGSRWSPLSNPPSGPGPVVEHDVWIGQGAFLARNITIGTGAVIGAGAVVTRNVEPYMIVAGNPARPIRSRFAPALVERLLASRWWDAHPDCLFRYGLDDPDRFLDRFEAARAARDLPDMSVRRYGYADIIAAIAAMEAGERRD